MIAGSVCFIFGLTCIVYGLYLIAPPAKEIQPPTPSPMRKSNSFSLHPATPGSTRIRNSHWGDEKSGSAATVNPKRQQRDAGYMQPQGPLPRCSSHLVKTLKQREQLAHVVVAQVARAVLSIST